MKNRKFSALCLMFLLQQKGDSFFAVLNLNLEKKRIQTFILVLLLMKKMSEICNPFPSFYDRTWIPKHFYVLQVTYLTWKMPSRRNWMKRKKDQQEVLFEMRGKCQENKYCVSSVEGWKVFKNLQPKKIKKRKSFPRNR